MRVLFARTPQINAAIADRWMSGMDLKKRLRVSSLKYEKDRAAAITAHRLLCRGLKETYGINPKMDDWAEGNYGKPYLKNTSGVHFNIAHSGQFVVCALHERAVGADIEMIRPVEESLAWRIMSDDERRAYYEAGKDEKLFFQIWTLKEAYLKYKGSGIGELGGITAYPQGGAIKSNVRGCRFALIECIPGYQAAICAKGLFELKAERVETSDLDRV